MAKYKHVGSTHHFKKEKSGFGEIVCAIIGVFIALMVIGALAG